MTETIDAALLRQLEALTLLGPPVYYHGGPAGRREGRWILPTTQTGIRPMHATRRDRVYLTPAPRAACIYAVMWAAPMLYVVEPFGELEPDPYPGADAYLLRPLMCRRAQVVTRYTLDAALIDELREGARPIRILPPRLRRG